MQLERDNLNDMLNKVLNTDLVYRDTLNLPSNVTFGVEIESERISVDKIRKVLKNNNIDWETHFDVSIYTGAEVSSKILRDDLRSWQTLKKTCELLKNNKAIITSNAGGHVHVGAHIIGNDIKAFKLFLIIYMLYEPIIARFLYGEYLTGRSGMIKYACNIDKFIYDNLEAILNINDIEELLKLFRFVDKGSAVNFSNINFYDIDTFLERNTIEFRGGNGTLEPVIWQNYINLATKILLFAKEGNVDEEWIYWQIKNFLVSDLSSMIYHGVDLPRALEFMNLIFTDETDKLYFLRQYLKDMRFGFGNDNKLSKKFIK